ncbi:MAG: hypothetical protein LIP03_08605 [Bacteroidales bacterium]|nr:hypothetical protein [Bacteroidales bacterium]
MMTEKYVDLESPFTGGKVKEVWDCERKEFRNEWFDVPVRYYVCEDTGEQFTTGEQDDLWTDSLYSQYRIKHGVPFPEEIKQIRLYYGLNPIQMSKVLGFGPTQYEHYENGQVPSESDANLLLSIKDNPSLLLEMVEEAKAILEPIEYDQIHNLILSVI